MEAEKKISEEEKNQKKWKIKKEKWLKQSKKQTYTIYVMPAIILPSLLMKVFLLVGIL